MSQLDELTPEEAELFGEPVPAAKPIVAPPPPKPKIDILPACSGCGVDLNPDIASRTREGKWVHTGCPAKQPAPAQTTPAATAPTPPPVEPAKRPKKQKEAPPASASVTIPVPEGSSASEEITKIAATAPDKASADPFKRLARALRAAADALES